MAKHRFNGEPGPGRPKGCGNKIHADIKAVIDTIRRVSDPETVERAVNKLWETEPRTMVQFFSRVAPKDLNIRTPDGIQVGQTDLSKLNDEEIQTMAGLMRKAQGADK